MKDNKVGDRYESPHWKLDVVSFTNETITYRAVGKSGQGTQIKKITLEEWSEVVSVDNGYKPVVEDPIAAIIYCPFCRVRHVDSELLRLKPHTDHVCTSCGKTWRIEPYCFGVPDTAVAWVDEQIAAIEDDKRYRYTPALVQVNAPLALEQTAMYARMMVLKKVRELLTGKAG